MPCGLPFHLAQSPVGKYSQGYSSNKGEQRNTSFYPSPPIIGWSVTLLGFVIAGYGPWKVNVRLYDLWWLLGLSVLVDLAVERI